MGEPYYSVRVAADPLDGGYVAECLDLPGCFGQGDTREEALGDLADAVRAVVELTKEGGGQGQQLACRY